MPVAPDNFLAKFGSEPSLESPPIRFGAITPSDTVGNELPEVPRCLFVGAAGTVQIKTVAGDSVQLTLPAGQFSMRYRQVFATGTTATGLSWGA